MSDSSKMIDALSDGNANGSLGSLGLNSTAHGDDADEQQGAMEGTHPVVTDEPHPVVTAEPQHDQPGANGEPPPTLFASNDGPNTHRPLVHATHMRKKCACHVHV